MRVSKGAGLGMKLTSAAARKNASWRASMARMEAGPGTRLGSVRARPEATFITAPIPALVMMFERAKNSLTVVTGKVYLHGEKVGLLKWLRMFSAVWTWINSWACTLVTISMARSSRSSYHTPVKFSSPAAKNADSRFSRKFTPWKAATAESEILAGGATLGGAPPALLMVCWLCCLGRTAAEVEAARRAMVVRSVQYMVDDW